MSHRSDDIIEVGPYAGLTRLEASEQERRKSTREEMQRHAAAVDAELTRHHREMDTIALTFGATNLIA